MLERKKENKNLFQKSEKNERSLKEVLNARDYEKVLPIVEYLEFEKNITPEKAER